MSNKAAEIDLVRRTARKMVEEGHDYVWFQLIIDRLILEGKVDHSINQRYGGSVFRGDGWVQIGTVWAGNRARGVNPSYRGVWVRKDSTKYIPKPTEDVLKQGTFDLRNGDANTKDAKDVLSWLDTEIEMQELNRRARLQ